MKCSFCKLNYIEKKLQKKGRFYLCKICINKESVDLKIENKKDILYLNQLRYRLRKQGLKVSNEFLNLCKLNAKLKRELCEKN